MLRGDDGFGVSVVERLSRETAPDRVKLMDVGTGGIHLVQELMAGSFDVVVVVDAVRMGRPPGTVLVVRPSVEDVSILPLHQRHDRLADMHYSTPDRALMLARAVGVLPDEVWVVGCEPADADSLARKLSPAVEGAVGVAIEEIKSVVRGYGIDW